MKITELKFDDAEVFACAEAYDKLDPEDRLSMSHIDLSRYSDIEDIESWKKFLKDPRVAEYINEEVKLYTEAQARKLITTATENDRSTGAAQMISALTKAAEDKVDNKTGNLFIYSYVPLNKKQRFAPNATESEFDIFNED